MNPNYDYDKLELDMITFERPDLSYEFDTLCFWVTKDGRVYSASDGGCSCPIPFEDYCGETLDEVLQKLERVGSLEQAEATFDAWNKDYDDKPFVGIDERRKLSVWIQANLKSA